MTSRVPARSLSPTRSAQYVRPNTLGPIRLSQYACTVHIVLVRPEIAPNTGAIIRLCANTGCDLHLVEPLGFRLDDRPLKRGGLDYHEYASVTVKSSGSTPGEAQRIRGG